MLETYWLALAIYAFAMTIVYLVVLPEERVYFSAGTAGAAWIFAALTAPTVERLTETGDVVAAAPGTVVQLFAAVLGLLSLLVVFLYRAGLYPPPDDNDAPDDTRMKA